MKENTMILGQDQYYSLNCYETKVNNNVLVVGTSGAGKTRSIVTPIYCRHREVIFFRIRKAIFIKNMDLI